MGLVFRWLVRIASGLIVLICAAVALTVYFATRSLPDYSGARSVEGLGAPLEIVRDAANVPHIFGQGDADVFFGLGYAHAQDRLWQMITLRRTAQGRLSELFGPRTLQTDALVRRFDLYGLAAASVSAQDAETTAALEAYADGVNARLRELAEGGKGRGAPEMFLFPHAIAPWQPADSIAVVKLLALQLSSHLRAEVLRAQLSLMLPPERLRDILPDSPGSGVAALPDYAAVMPGASPETLLAAAARRRGVDGAAPMLFPVAPRGLAGASNAWAAAPARSAAGGTLLANDPHLGFTAPTIWYLARLELETGGVIGGTIPGVPVVMTGRSERLGWGITASYLDDTDVLMEELHPEDPTRYRGPEGWESFRTRQSIIEVKDGQPLTLTLRWSANGPVLPPDAFDLGTVTPRGHVPAVAWTALSATDTTLSAAMALMRAGSVTEALASADRYVAPSQVLTLADETQIALALVGAMPQRASTHATRGRMPALGWKEENRWRGMLPAGAAPRFVNPEGGILGNTNNKLVDRPFPRHLSWDWGDSQRIQRWERLMQSRQVHTRESFVEAQLDTVSITARTLLPLVGAELWFTGEAAPSDTPEGRRRQALALLADWNGEMNEHLPEPLLYAAWMRALQDRLIRDELGPLARAFTHLEPLFVERVFRDVDGASAWCDVIQSSPRESCAEIARLALDDALVQVAERHGSALESLRWGDAHEATHDHPVLGDIPILRWIVNIRQSTSGGDNTLMRGATSGREPHPFRNVHGAGYRGVYDFADPDSSVFVTATGQSGHPLSRHYDDLGERWRRGEYVPMSLDPALARAAAVGITTLAPP